MRDETLQMVAVAIAVGCLSFAGIKGCATVEANQTERFKACMDKAANPLECVSTTGVRLR